MNIPTPTIAVIFCVYIVSVYGHAYNETSFNYSMVMKKHKKAGSCKMIT